MEIQAFEIGGCVRDEIMGQRPKDVDYTVVAPSFEAMRDFVLSNDMKIVVETPEFFTIRAVTKTPFRGRRGGLDFVWARQEGPYSDGRHPDWVKPGTLIMDQQRRDFTMNALAKDADGNIIDHFRGQEDIADGIIRCVGSAEDRIREDALRGLRALRFKVTKRMTLDKGLIAVLDSDWFPDLLRKVSKERQREEVEKMFAFDTLASLCIFSELWMVGDVVFSDGLRLSATMKGKYE